MIYYNYSHHPISPPGVTLPFPLSLLFPPLLLVASSFSQNGFLSSKNITVISSSGQIEAS